MKTVEGICGICPGGCAVEIDLEDGALEKLHPSKKHNPSALCLRGSKAKDIVYSEDRLKTPLIRTGSKGKWNFREATWEEALTYTAENFLKIYDTYGAHTLASHFGRGSFEQTTDDFIQVSNTGNQNPGFFAPLGSPNGATVGSLCFNAFGVFAPMTTMGLTNRHIVPDIENAEVVFIWGANPPTGSPPFMYQRLKAAQKCGVKLITIDHFKNLMAKQSDQYIEIRSGTDHVLILAMIRHIIEKKLYDREFVMSYTHGFEKLAEYVRSFTLEQCEKITGVPSSTTLQLIQILTTKRVALNLYTGLEYSNSGVQSIRAIYSLWALTGQLDRQGGLLLMPPNSVPALSETPMKKSSVCAIGQKEFPIFHHFTSQPQFLKFPESVLQSDPYPIRGLLNCGSAITINYPNAELFAKALSQLEFFVTIDRFPTPDMKYADVVFPATTYFEDQSYMVYPNHVRIRERMIDPIGQSRPNIFILHDIAEKMGFGYLYPKDETQLYEMRFRNMPEVLQKIQSGEKEIFFAEKPPVEYQKFQTGKIRNDHRPGFPTPTGKFEFDSEVLKSFGYDGLPIYESAWEGKVRTPKLADQYPLVMNTGARIQSTFRSQHLNIEALVSYQPDPMVLLHTKDAQERQIEDGNHVIVESPRGKIEMIAHVIDGIPKGEVEINVGGGSDIQKNLWATANVNYLTDKDNVDPISGFPVFKNLLCDVRKIRK